MTQLDFPFPLDEEKLTAFLTRVCAIEDEQDRLREELQEVRAAYAAAVPLRAVTAALKIVRTTRKLADHPKEPMTRMHLTRLCTLVEQHLDTQQQDAERAMEALVVEGMMGRIDPTTGEITEKGHIMDLHLPPCVGERL